MLDAIPLAEFIGVESMIAIRERESSDEHPHNDFEKAMDFTCALQIRTIKNGYNAGRKYFLRANSDEERDDLVKQLLVLSKNAKARAETASAWEKMQNRVRRVYNSSLFQGVAAFLIIAVSAPSRRKGGTAQPLRAAFRRCTLSSFHIRRICGVQAMGRKGCSADSAGVFYGRVRTFIHLLFRVFYARGGFSVFCGLLRVDLLRPREEASLNPQYSRPWK
jgi:hypothetical protein